jgi:hypothetical protein
MDTTVFVFNYLMLNLLHLKYLEFLKITVENFLENPQLYLNFVKKEKFVIN